MKIKAFAEMVLELLGRNQQDYLVDERVVIATAQTMLGKLLDDKLKNGETLATYYTSFILPVETDAVRAQKYITLVPRAMNIGDNDGIAQIGHVMNEYDWFLFLKPSQLAQYSFLEAGQMGGMVGARPEGDRVYFMNLPTTTTEVLVKMIPQMVDLPIDAEMPGSSSEVEAVLLDLTLQKLSMKVQLGEDKVGDNQSLKS